MADRRPGRPHSGSLLRGSGLRRRVYYRWPWVVCRGDDLHGTLGGCVSLAVDGRSMAYRTRHAVGDGIALACCCRPPARYWQPVRGVIVSPPAYSRAMMSASM